MSQVEWFSNNRIVFCRYSENLRGNAKLVFYPEHILRLALIDIYTRGEEWLVIGKGHVREQNGVKEYVVTDLVIPRQTVTSSHVSVKAGNSVNGIVEIHRHPFDMSSFSGTDIEYFNYPVMALVYGSATFRIKAVVKQKLPCGLLGAVAIPVVVLVNGKEVDVNKFIDKHVKGVNNITRTTVHEVHEPYRSLIEI